MARIDGRYYSCRPPMLPLFAAGLYALESHFFGWRFADGIAARRSLHQPPAYFFMVWLISGLATAVMGFQLARSLALLGLRRRRCWAAGLLLGLGSLALPYATVLNHHSVAGALIASATFYLLRGQLNARRTTGTVAQPGGLTSQRDWFSPMHALVTGLCAGFAATVDVAVGGLFLVAALAWVLAVPALRRQVHWGLLGVLIPGVLHCVLNYQITSDIVPALVRKEYFDYPHTSIPLDGLSGLPHHTTPAQVLPYLAKLLWGPRGLFTYSPPLLFSVVAAARLVRSRGQPLRLAATILLAWGGVFLLYLAIYTVNFSGACYGIRWFVPLLPAGYLALFGGWSLLRTFERRAAGVALATSMLVAWWGAIYGPWQMQHLVPVLWWRPPLPEWSGAFGQWAGDVPLLGWIMLLATAAVVFAPLVRWLARRIGDAAAGGAGAPRQH